MAMCLSGKQDSGNTLRGRRVGISPASGGRANLEVGNSEFWRYSCFRVTQIYVSLPERTFIGFEDWITCGSSGASRQLGPDVCPLVF